MKKLTIKDYRSINTIGFRLIPVIFAVILLVTGVFMQANVYAEEGSSDAGTVGNVFTQGVAGGGYEVTGYVLDAVVGKDHTITVKQDITVNIPDTLQRIDFAIPSGSFRMRDLSVEGVAFSSRIATEGSTVTILDPAALGVGIHTYSISYRIMEFADRDPSKDIFYYSVLLPEWKQPIGDLDITVHLPDKFPWKELKCYAGQFGVQDTENRLLIKNRKKAGTVTITGSKIPENFGITLKAQLPDGYWEGALDGIWAILAMVLVMGSVTLILFVLWIIGGRDPRFKRTIETKPIEGVSPVEIGYIFNSEMDIRDLVRLILYFGTKGYLKISEYEPKRYRLIRIKDPEGEEKLIRNAYNILFEDVYKGRGLDMDQIGGRLVRIMNAIRDDVAAGFASKEMLAYTPLSRGFRYAGIALIAIGVMITNALKYSYQYLPINYAESAIFGLIAAILLFLLCLVDDRKYSSSDNTGSMEEIIIGMLLAFLGIYMAIGIVRQTRHLLVALAVLGLLALAAFLTVIMRARGKGNAALVMRFRQLRRFIYHPTPKELLENHLADENYYYDMMIYALTFGAEESWAISFLTLDVPEPGWYSDDIEGHAFSNLREKPETIDYAKDLRSFVRTIETAYEDMKHRRRR